MMTLAEFLEILNNAAPDNGPWTEESGHAEALNGAFADLAKALATYVETTKALVPYGVVRDSLEQLVHTFPVVENPVDPFESIEKALMEAMGLTEAEAKELFGDAIQHEQ